ncbi:MAG: hypothetical protein OXC07_02335 [Kistimonas sp.]|nr:hypothetical protein [Kistimonas sp.]
MRSTARQVLALSELTWADATEAVPWSVRVAEVHRCLIFLSRVLAVGTPADCLWMH